MRKFRLWNEQKRVNEINLVPPLNFTCSLAYFSDLVRFFFCDILYFCIVCLIFNVDIFRNIVQRSVMYLILGKLGFYDYFSFKKMKECIQ